MTNEALQKRIMQRVTRMYYLKKAVNPITLKLYALAALGVGVEVVISVRSVLANMPSLLDFKNLAYFTEYTIVHTETSVQVMVLAAAVVAIFLVRDSFFVPWRRLTLA